jgi:hypothetical protein
MVAQQPKLKAKVPTYPERKVQIRRVMLEVLFFGALAVFGFSLVFSWLGGTTDQGAVVRFAPNIEMPNLGAAQEVAAAGLYEAPSQRAQEDFSLSPIFTPSVQYWKDDLIRWSAEHNLDPNLAATVMQIESCGNPNAGSGAGAMGLFQVMPFHFEADEEPYDPDTNALRGLNYLAAGLEVSGGHAGLALAGYNGGHGVIYKSYDQWHSETQRYYRWGSGIYREASAGWESSPTLLSWLSAGGQSLCTSAEDILGITSNSPNQTAYH